MEQQQQQQTRGKQSRVDPDKRFYGGMLAALDDALYVPLLAAIPDLNVAVCTVSECDDVIQHKQRAHWPVFFLPRDGRRRGGMIKRDAVDGLRVVLDETRAVHQRHGTHVREKVM